MNNRRLKNDKTHKERIDENRKFNTGLFVGFITLSAFLVSILVFYTYGCDTKLLYRKYFLFDKKISSELICMTESVLKHHNTKHIELQNESFTVCSLRCQKLLESHYADLSYARDAFSNEKIKKSNAIIGLKDKGKSEVVFFKNMETFNRYYERIN